MFTAAQNVQKSEFFPHNLYNSKFYEIFLLFWSPILLKDENISDRHLLSANKEKPIGK